jgi:hypothetical protein
MDADSSLVMTTTRARMTIKPLLKRRKHTGEASPFTTIAAKPDFDAAKLAFFMLDPHPKMPDMSLFRTEAVDLAAYIASLK